MKPIKKREVNRKQTAAVLGAPETYDHFFKVVAAGEPSYQFCKLMEIPLNSLMGRIKADPELKKRYEDACEARALTHVDRIEKIINDVEIGSMDAHAAKVSMDARKWLATKMDPNRFGDRQRVDLTTTDMTTLHLEAIRELGMSENIIDVEGVLE
tara:strand:- start:2186 stop:2650 length:465 start_codon:yes stop_codon:yes gene_type:complete